MRSVISFNAAISACEISFNAAIPECEKGVQWQARLLRRMRLTTYVISFNAAISACETGVP
eukprot:5033068-Karenia_brevis.AAC.1